MIQANKHTRNLILLLAIVCNIGCDRVAKNIARNSLEAHQNVELLNGHLFLTKVENTGAFLSLGDDLPAFEKTLILSLLPALALIFMVFWLFRQEGLTRPTALAICCVVGGGIGNIYDRLMYGSVTDFLYLQAGELHTGIFNFADMSITAGVLLLMVLGLRNRWTA